MSSLFGKRRIPNPFPTSPEIGLLGAGTRFTGTIRFKGTMRLDGEVEGDIYSEQGSGSSLVINRNATVAGSIISDAVIISGHVEGDIIAQERVEIFRTGSLKGDIYTNQIMIEGGADFEGRCSMIRHLDAEQQRTLSDKLLRPPKPRPRRHPEGETDPLNTQYTA